MNKNNLGEEKINQKKERGWGDLKKEETDNSEEGGGNSPNLKVVREIYPDKEENGKGRGEKWTKWNYLRVE